MESGQRVPAETRCDDERQQMKRISIFSALLFYCLSASAGEIDRPTFSLSLPASWTENTHDDMYNANSFVFFEKGETALFNVIIGDRKAGATPEPMVRRQESNWRNKLTNLKFTDLRNWSRYKGAGVELEGDMQEVVRVRARIFGF